MFEAAALSACPADATPATGGRRRGPEEPGGHGAVREFIERILARDGKSRIVTHKPGS
jgi:3-deoxy-D-manno-octulosonate 8-phosphate phosphatase KdsC-like HAD superfamily phosphatase